MLGSINSIRTQWGAAVQNVTTAAKAGFVLLLAALPFLATGEKQTFENVLWPEQWNVSLLAGIGTAVAAIMWAYDGWGTLTVIAEEVKNPQRNVPLALTIGVLILITLYCGANWAYHATLPADVIAKSQIPASDVAAALLPGWGDKLLSAVLLVSVFGALNGNILVGPRVLFAAGRDYPRLRALKSIDARTGTPAIAIAALCGWSICLIMIGDLLPGDGTPLGSVFPFNFVRMDKPLFDLLTDYCIFGGSMFYLFAVIGVFVLRWRRPDAPRPYRAWGYPVVPMVFVAGFVFLLVSMLVGTPIASLGGLALIAAGIPVHWWLNSGDAGVKRRPDATDTAGVD
jgi:amino acid transporter